MNERIERIDIHDPLRELCERLGLDYKNVARLDIKPSFVEADVFKVNGDGKKYLAGGVVAIDTFRFFVST